VTNVTEVVRKPQGVTVTGGAPATQASTAKYRVVLPIAIGEATYAFGQVVELDAATAKLYNHALVRVEEEK